MNRRRSLKWAFRKREPQNAAKIKIQSSVLMPIMSFFKRKEKQSEADQCFFE